MALLSNTRQSSREDGYVLITMLLTVSLMTIAALAVLPSITFEIKREREKEMIHRGVQYSRAIRTYYKKFGRYPTRLEDLDNTNNLRYLRKHYKDPITGQDFKLLHFGEPGLTLGGSFGGGTIPGANPIGGGAGANGAAGSNSAFGGSGFGNTGNSGFGNASNSGFGNTGVNNSGVFSQSSSFGGNANGGNSNGGFGANSNAQSGSAQPGTNAAAGSDSTQASTQVAAGTAQGDTSSSGQQLIASGPIVGVASVSKKTTIREFNHKKKYNEWQFVYDPTLDRGGLITTPYQPALQSFGGQAGQNVNAQPGSSSGGLNGTSSGSSFGNSFGQQPGMSNGPNSPGGLTPPQQPPSTPPQQQ
jgi:type II secretory pathway pseudopilin PulG